MARSDPPLTDCVRRGAREPPAGPGPALALPITWLEQRLAESDARSSSCSRAEPQQQAADQVSVSNSIGSLRFLGATDWRDFVEAMSVVEQDAARRSGGMLRRMDFATRDRYRHVVEKLAQARPESEDEVARAAIELARQGAATGNADRARRTSAIS